MLSLTLKMAKYISMIKKRLDKIKPLWYNKDNKERKRENKNDYYKNYPS